MKPTNNRKERQIAKKLAPRVMNEALLAIKETVNKASSWQRTKIAFNVLRGTF